jgi:hypothetical protein
VVHPGGARLLGRDDWATNWCTCLVTCADTSLVLCCTGCHSAQRLATWAPLQHQLAA